MKSLTRERLIKSFAVVGILILCTVVVFKTENILISFVLGFVIYYILAPVVMLLKEPEYQEGLELPVCSS